MSRPGPTRSEVLELMGLHGVMGVYPLAHRNCLGHGENTVGSLRCKVQHHCPACPLRCAPCTMGQTEVTKHRDQAVWSSLSFPREVQVPPSLHGAFSTRCLKSSESFTTFRWNNESWDKLHVPDKLLNTDIWKICKNFTSMRYMSAFQINTPHIISMTSP